MKPNFISLWLTLLFSMTLLLSSISPAMAQLPLPIITAAQTDVPNSRLVITGTGFGGTRPTVTLPNGQLTVSTFNEKA